jgi:hypothetical protein
MSIQDRKADDESRTASKTYLEFHSDGLEAEQEAYQLIRRGGSIREGVEDVDELYARPRRSWLTSSSITNQSR